MCKKGCIMSELSMYKICQELMIKKPVVYFTPDGKNEKISIWYGDGIVLSPAVITVASGYYEIKESQFGPIILHVFEGNTIYRLRDCEVRMVVKKEGGIIDSEKENAADYGASVRFVADSIYSNKIEPSGISVKKIENRWKRYEKIKEKKPLKSKKVKGLGAYDIFKALAYVHSRPRPFDLSDFNLANLRNDFQR